MMSLSDDKQADVIDVRKPWRDICTYYLSLITYYLSLITYYLLLITYYLLLITYHFIYHPYNGAKLHCTFPVIAVAVVRKPWRDIFTY